METKKTISSLLYQMQVERAYQHCVKYIKIKPIGREENLCTKSQDEHKRKMATN